jgi:hypothetical protein
MQVREAIESLHEFTRFSDQMSCQRVLLAQAVFLLEGQRGAMLRNRMKHPDSAGGFGISPADLVWICQKMPERACMKRR